MIQRSIFLLSLIFIKTTLGFDGSSSSNVAIYWGQNSGGSQDRLSTYCESESVDIVLLSFLSSFPTIKLNFANQCSDTFSSGLLHCSTIGEDIKTCQSLGKKVLLSLGGSKGNYGFTSDDEATQFAETLWNKFGGGNDNERPFDDAVIDGFDFDIENKDQTGYPALGEALRSYFDKDTSKTYYLSSSPQCPYPDQSVGNLLDDVDIDFVFIQFYNNYCNLGTNFNWNSWANYATSTSPNKNVKIFLGLPSSSSAASSGYNPASVVSTYVDSIKSGSNFGGIALWDASSAWANTDGENYAKQMKDLLGGSSTASTSTWSTASTSTWSTASTSTWSTAFTSTASTATASTITTSTSIWSTASTSISSTATTSTSTWSTAYTSTLSKGSTSISTWSTAFTSTLKNPTIPTSSTETNPSITIEGSTSIAALPTTTKNIVTTLTTKILNPNNKIVTDTAPPVIQTVTYTNYQKTVTATIFGAP